LLAAEAREVPVLSYAEALGRCMEGRSAVAVAGTHGKSTTTAMLGAALTDAGLDPTVIVGATCGQLENGCLAETAEPVGFRLGSERIPRGSMAGAPGLLIAEACEFNRSFHNYRPLVASISSVEADHLDVYGSLDAVVESFHEFAKLVAPAEECGGGGRLLIAHEGAHRREVTAGVACRVETIGFNPEADWVVAFEPATKLVRLTNGPKLIAEWTMTLAGVHNAMNAATACALATMVGAEPEKLARSLAAFRGVDRRMQLLGERQAPLGGGSVRVFDDYGHHPTEVAATLRALRDFEKPHERGGRLICVFQPHQHSRTRHLLEEFASAFSAADVVIVPHIYFVRDSQEERHKVTAADLVDKLRHRGVRAMHLYPFEAIVEQLETLCRGGDVVVAMGAGPVWQVGKKFVEARGH
jgi:UDP-N-acetylmuramate--alanine ligase